MLEQERLSARKQARRWLVDVIAGQHDAMFPSTPEKHAFFALSKLPTDQALYEALTEEKVSQKVKMLYARYFRQRDKVRREQGSTYYTVAVADWWVLPEANKKMTKADKRAKKAGKTTKKAETLAKQAEIRAKFKNWGKVVADQGVVKGYNEVSWEKLGGERPQEKGKGEHFFALNMPLRGPRI